VATVINFLMIYIKEQ